MIYSDDMKINDCMQAACNQSVSVCIGVRSLVKSSLDLRSSFFFCCVSLPQYGDKYAHYSEYASDTIGRDNIIYNLCYRQKMFDVNAGPTCGRSTSILLHRLIKSIGTFTLAPINQPQTIRG